MITIICQDCTQSTSGDCGKHGDPIEEVVREAGKREPFTKEDQASLKYVRARVWSTIESAVRAALQELCKALQHPDYFRAGTDARERLQNAYEAAEKALAAPHAALDAALVAARHEAAEAMREACARVAEAIPVPVGSWPEIKRSGRLRERTAAAIRAVPLPDGEATKPRTQ